MCEKEIISTNKKREVKTRLACRHMRTVERFLVRGDKQREEMRNIT